MDFVVVCIKGWKEKGYLEHRATMKRIPFLIHS